jgi:hypothetical protein
MASSPPGAVDVRRALQELCLTRAPRHLLYLILLWLTAATVAAHAVVPVGSPVERRSGSAFSAATSDVTLAGQRTGSALIKRDQAGPDDPGFGDPPALIWAAAVPALQVATAAPYPDPSAAPFTRTAAPSSFRARAPPYA